MTVIPVGYGGTADFWKMETATTAGGAGTNPWNPVTRASNPGLSLAVGDFLWAQVAWHGAEAPNISAPAGWTVVTGYPFVQSATLGLALYWRVVTDPATEAASYLWQPKATDGTTDQAARGSVGIRVYRGVDPNNPLDVTPSRSAGGTPAVAGTTFNASQVTTVTPGAYVLSGMALDAGTTGITFTVPAGTTKIWDLIGRRSALAEEGAQAVPGPSGVLGWASSAASISYVGYQAALRPGAPGWVYRHTVLIT